MKRRDFIKLGVGTGALIAVPALAKTDKELDFKAIAEARDILNNAPVPSDWKPLDFTPAPTSTEIDERTQEAIREYNKELDQVFSNTQEKINKDFNEWKDKLPG